MADANCEGCTMKTTPHDPVCVTGVQAVRKGEPIPMPALQGGYVRRPAPSDGVLVYTSNDVHFVSWMVIDGVRPKGRK